MLFDRFFKGPDYITIFGSCVCDTRFEPFWLSIFLKSKSNKLVNMFRSFKSISGQELKIDWIETRNI